MAEIITTAIASAILLLFVQYGALEYDRMRRHIEEEKMGIPRKVSKRQFNESLELEKHWNLIVVGSIIGFLAIIARVLFHYFTGNLPTIIGNEVVDVATTALVLFIFLWFLYIGINEYNDIKRQLSKQYKA